MARRRRNRAGLEEDRKALHLLPWRQVRNRFPPIEPLSDDQIEAIHRTSMRVLDELGMKVLDGETRSILKEAGARTDEASEMVYMEPGLVEQAIATTPSSFTVHARNPERNIEVGGNAINFTPVAGPAFVSDLDRGRRAGTYAELCEFVKLEQMFDIIHVLGVGAFASLDLPRSHDISITGWRATSMVTRQCLSACSDGNGHATAWNSQRSHWVSTKRTSRQNRVSSATSTRTRRVSSTVPWPRG